MKAMRGTILKKYLLVKIFALGSESFPNPKNVDPNPNKNQHWFWVPVFQTILLLIGFNRLP
jgi:hypothetical protein